MILFLTISVAHAKWTELKGAHAQGVRDEILNEMSTLDFRCQLNGYEYPYSIIKWYAVNLLPHVFQEDTGKIALMNAYEDKQSQMIFDFHSDETIRLIDFYYVERDRNGKVTTDQRAICQ